MQPPWRSGVWVGGRGLRGSQKSDGKRLQRRRRKNVGEADTDTPMLMADLVVILDKREQAVIYDRRARQLSYSN